MEMKKRLSKIIPFIITVFFTVLVIYKVNWTEIADTFGLLNPKYLLILFPSILIIMAFRAIRWNILLPKHNCPLYTLYEIYLTSNLLNIFLPARGGDIFRGCYFGHKYNLSKLNVLGTVAAERIFDGLTVLAMLLIGIILHNKSEIAVHLAISAAVLFVFSFLFMLWVYKYKKIDALCNFAKKIFAYLPQTIGGKLINIIDKIQPYLDSFITGFESFANPKTLFKAALLSVIAWGTDCIFIYTLILAFGIKVSFLVTLFILSFIALSTIIPSSSMYVGLYQYAFILASEIFGIDKSSAFALSIMQQGLLLFSYFFIFIIFVIRNNVKLDDIKKDTKSEGK